MRYTTALLLCCLFLLLPARVSAEAVSIETMQIDIWPEYDQPEVLVIFHFTLANTVTLPTELTVRIPASSGGPFNLAYVNVNTEGESELYNLDYDTQQSGDWMDVTFSAPTSSIQLEYYDPGLQRSGDQRNFEFIWPASYSVESLAVQVLQPANAVDVRLDPPMEGGGVYQDGRTYHHAMLGAVEAGQQVKLAVKYSKPDDSLSEGYDAVFATEDQTTLLPSSSQNPWAWVLAAVGAVLVTVAVVWYLLPNRLSPFQRGSKTPASEKALTRRTNVYCHNCGTVSSPEDVFCRMCGTKLRK